MSTLFAPHLHRFKDLKQLRQVLSIHGISRTLSSYNIIGSLSHTSLSQTCVLTHHRRWSSSFIPLSSKSLFKKLVGEKNKYDIESLCMFDKFGIGIEMAIANKNFNILSEMKLLYDPLNPDVSTAGSKLFGKKELSDREFWFLQKLSSHLGKGGFTEVDTVYLKKCLSEKPVGQGVVADVNLDKFEIIKCWVLCDVEFEATSPPPLKPIYEKIGFLVKEPTSNKLYKRVVMATRLKSDDKLSLKMFKDIPTNQLHLLLPPSGGLRMHDSYRNLILMTTSLSGLFFLSRYAVAGLLGSSHHLGFVPVGFSAFFGLIGVALWSNFKQRQKRHLSDVLEVMFNRFVVGNQNLLPIISEKVQEEIMKGILITYYFLLTKPHTEIGEKIGQSSVSEITANELEQRINTWIKTQTGKNVTFGLDESLSWLAEMGIVDVNPETNVIHTLPLPAALKILPIPGQHRASSHLMVAKMEEFDLFHGDLAEATNLEKRDLVDRITSAVRKQLTRFQRKY